MSELRQNLITRRWVIIASDRARRPNELAQAERVRAHVPDWEATCPFCPGNEELDLEVLRVPEAGDWQVRMVRNLYPAVTDAGEVVRNFSGIYRHIDGIGYHEVLVESPHHNPAAVLADPQVTRRVLHTFQTRGRQIAADPRMEHIIYFKNHGEKAGTSLIHPHTQLIALPIVPYGIRNRVDEARRYFDDTGRCVVCATLAEEQRDGRRVIASNEHFVAFVPYAAYTPFHTWIVPRRHNGSFLHATPHELDALSDLLHRLLRTLFHGLNDPDYNYVIRSAPLNEPGQDYLHWYLSIIPRLTYAAGFELGTGMFINPVKPEEAAAFLREEKEKIEE